MRYYIHYILYKMYYHIEHWSFNKFQKYCKIVSDYNAKRIRDKFREKFGE